MNFHICGDKFSGISRFAKFNKFQEDLFLQMTKSEKFRENLFS